MVDLSFGVGLEILEWSQSKEFKFLKFKELEHGYRRSLSSTDNWASKATEWTTRRK